MEMPTQLFYIGKQDSAKGEKIIPKLMPEDHQVVTKSPRAQEGKQNVMSHYFDGLLGSTLPRVYTLDLNFSRWRASISRHWTQQLQKRRCGIE
jgi:hypothetical protein